MWSVGSADRYSRRSCRSVLHCPEKPETWMFANYADFRGWLLSAWMPIPAIPTKRGIRGNSRSIGENPRPGFRVLSSKQDRARKDQIFLDANDADRNANPTDKREGSSHRAIPCSLGTASGGSCGEEHPEGVHTRRLPHSVRGIRAPHGWIRPHSRGTRIPRPADQHDPSLLSRARESIPISETARRHHPADHL